MGGTSDLLKYSWGFLHFNLPFKRWLFPRLTAPRGKRFPAPWQSWTNVGWEPLRASGLLTDGLLQAGQLNTFGPALVPSHNSWFRDSLLPAARRLLAGMPCEWRWVCHGLGNTAHLQGFVFSKFWFPNHWICLDFFSDPLRIALLELNSFKGICGLWREEPPKCLRQTICYLCLGVISRWVDLTMLWVFGRIRCFAIRLFSVE